MGGCGAMAPCLLLASHIYSSGMISVVFITDGFDGPGSLPRTPAAAGASDHPGGRVAGHVQRGSPGSLQPGRLCREAQDDCADSANRYASAVSG